jgi:IS5 family transposase
MKVSQFGFFDESERLDRLTRLHDPLLDLSRLIDFEIFRPVLKDAFSKIQGERKSPAGRKPLDPVFMLKILILQRNQNLSDQQVEIQVLDRSTFRRFLGITAEADVPDFSTVWRFRDSLAKADAIKPLFDAFAAVLEERGLILKAGTIVDATFVEVPRQRNTPEENETIKRGEVPEAWKQNPRKLCQKDVDARWTKKNEVSFYGYKNHVKADAGSKLLTDYEVSDASEHDSQRLDALVTEENRGESLFADGAYKSGECDERLRSLGVGNYIHHKGARNHPLGEMQKAINSLKSKVRCTVEHIFGFMENSMGGPQLEYIGLKRISAGIGLTNLTYNIRRYVQLVKMGMEARQA